ncbi:MAG: hypothetical protein IKK82_09125 [Kiritimatiellae bacterium]|nr:hypothetical protein [Kiritimatiellia bacterium]
MAIGALRAVTNASAAATPASAEALLAVKKVVRSARPRTPRPPRGSAAEAMIRRHGMKVSFDINLSLSWGMFSGRDLRRASSHRFDLRSAAVAGHESSPTRDTKNTKNWDVSSPTARQRLWDMRRN